MPDPILQTHPEFERLSPRWQFYADHYEGGIEYPAKMNPTLVATSSHSHPSPNYQGAKCYLWQYPSEPGHRYEHRLNRAWFVDVLAPVVDFYAGAVGKGIQIERTGEGDWTAILDDVDLRGHSIEEFLQEARSNAAVYGLTFLHVDSTRAQGPVITQADAVQQNVRPYLREILPTAMRNWRLDPQTGRILEAIFEGPPAASQSLLGDEEKPVQVLFYWSTTEWRKYEVRKSEAGLGALQVGGDAHSLGVVPIIPLFHKQCLRDGVLAGESLLKNSAKLANLLTNWASALDEAFENQMFAVPVLKSKDKPSEIGVGTSSVLHLNPEEGEEFSYVTPETAPFEVSWEAFFRLISLANIFMGVEAPNLEGKATVQSGVSKAWDYVKADKVMTRMATNEQESAKSALQFFALWMGKAEFPGTVQYPQEFDTSSLDDDLNQLLKAQAAGLPPSARKAMKKKYIAKALPSLDEKTQHDIFEEIDNEPDMATLMLDQPAGA